jgi:hypothetical protein
VRQSDAARVAITVTAAFQELRLLDETMPALTQRLGPDGLRVELERRLGPDVVAGADG